MNIFIVYLIIGVLLAKPYWWDHPRACGGYEIDWTDLVSIVIWSVAWPVFMIMRLIWRLT